jgi:hypothetical protein
MAPPAPAVPPRYEVELVDRAGNRFAATVEVLGPASPGEAWAWDEREWIVLPNGDGLHRGDVGPCGICGATVFLVALGGVAGVRIYCKACEPSRFRIWRSTAGVKERQDPERVVGWVDAAAATYHRGFPAFPR